jgi:hypothetical protein
LEAARRVLFHYGKGTILSDSSDLARHILDTCGRNSSAKVVAFLFLLSQFLTSLLWTGCAIRRHLGRRP